jgi:hypothetical protein
MTIPDIPKPVRIGRGMINILLLSMQLFPASSID